MKTSVIKKTCVLLAAIIATTCLAACKKNNDSSTVTPPPKKDETIIVDTDKYIVKDKSSEYSVLLPRKMQIITFCLRRTKQSTLLRKLAATS